MPTTLFFTLSLLISLVKTQLPGNIPVPEGTKYDDTSVGWSYSGCTQFVDTSCVGCGLSPDINRMFDKTYHDCSLNNQVATFQFQGTGVDVFGVCPGPVPIQGTSDFQPFNGNLSFTLDGQFAGSLQLPVGGCNEWIYNQLLVSKTGLSDGLHQLSITSLTSQAPYSYVLIDYAVVNPTTASSQSAQPPPPKSSAQPPPTSSPPASPSSVAPTQPNSSSPPPSVPNSTSSAQGLPPASPSGSSAPSNPSSSDPPDSQPSTGTNGTVSNGASPSGTLSNGTSSNGTSFHSTGSEQASPSQSGALSETESGAPAPTNAAPANGTFTSSETGANADPSQSPSSLSHGAIAGIAIAATIPLLAMALAAAFLVRRWQQNSESSLLRNSAVPYTIQTSAAATPEKHSRWLSGLRWRGEQQALVQHSDAGPVEMPPHYDPGWEPEAPPDPQPSRRQSGGKRLGSLRWF